MFDWLDENAPNWLSVMLSALVPLLAFGIPWTLAGRSRDGAGGARRRAILVSAFPVLVIWLVLNSVLAPAHHTGKPPSVLEGEAAAVRAPRTVGELMLRVGIGGLGAAGLIWLCGAAAGRAQRRKKAADGDGGEGAGS